MPALPSHPLRPAAAPARASRRGRGFTLVELVVAMAVAAIIAAVAFPTFSAQLAKGRRADGKQALMEVAQLLERYFTERGSYVGASLGAGGLYPATSRAGHYTLSLSAVSAEAYTLVATPTGAQLRDSCGTYRIDQTGSVSVSGAGATVASCW